MGYRWLAGNGAQPRALQAMTRIAAADQAGASGGRVHISDLNHAVQPPNGPRISCGDFSAWGQSDVPLN
jgi:hypothetical protein